MVANSRTGDLKALFEQLKQFHILNELILNRDFSIWHTKTRAVISDLFGYQSIYLKDFEKLKLRSPRSAIPIGEFCTTPPWNKLEFKIELERAEIIFKAM